MGGFDRLTRYESAAFTWDYFLWLPQFAILSVLGYRESGVSILGIFRPRHVHRHASGAAQCRFGALPALNHISELSAGRGHC